MGWGLKRPPKWARLLAELLVIFVVLACLEAGYRLYKLNRYGTMEYPDVQKLGYVEWDPVYGMRVTKNFRSQAAVPLKMQEDPTLRDVFGAQFTTNSWGYRGPEFSARKSPGTFRIVVLGDSAVMNMEMSDADTWPLKLGTLLQTDSEFLAARGANRVEVINAGHIGWRSREGLIRLREEVSRFEPDLVLIAFNWSDVTCGLAGQNADAVMVPPNQWWRRVKIIENLWVRFKVEQLKDKRYNDRRRSRIQRSAPWADSFSRNLVSMERFSSGIGSEARLVNLPGLCRRQGLETGEYQQVIQRTRVNPEEFRLWVDVKEFVSALFQEVSDRTGIPLIDVADRFEAFSGARRVDLFRDEVHATPEGAGEIARGVYQALTSS